MTDPQNDREPDSSSDGEERKPLYRWLNILGILMLIICFLLALGVMGLRWYLGKDLPASERAKLRTFMSEPLHFPKEWADVEPVSPDLLVAQEAVILSLQSHPRVVAELGHDSDCAKALYEIENRSPVPAETWTSFSGIVSYGMPVLEETSRAVAMSGYCMDLVDLGFGPTPYDNSCVSVLACAAAHVRAREGKWRQAFEFALLPLKQSRRDLFPGRHTYDFAPMFQRRAVQSLGVLVPACPEPEVLLFLLESLAAERSLVNPVVRRKHAYLSGFGHLRQMKRFGYPVDLSPGKPHAYYVGEAIETEVSEFPLYMQQHLPDKSLHRKRFDSMAVYGAKGMSGLGIGLELQLFCLLVPERHYAVIWPDDEQIGMREQIDLLEYDGLRLTAARRIMELRGETPPAEAAGFVPRYLPEEPMDPFSGTSFLRDSATGRLYSVGPDRKDDRLSVLYDPTNRTVSGGDLILSE